MYDLYFVGFDDESSKNARNEMLLAENKRLREELTESKVINIHRMVSIWSTHAG